MPAEYQRDDVRRLVRITPLDPVSLDDVTGALNQQIADGVWHYGALVDARRGIISGENAAALLEWVGKVSMERGLPGPIAMVTRERAGTASSFAFRSARVGLQIEVFWDIDEAERWLAAKMRVQREC